MKLVNGIYVQEHAGESTACAVSQTALSLRELEKVKQSLDKVKVPSPEVLVMTKEIWEELRKLNPGERGLSYSTEQIIPPSYLGIPVEYLETEEECTQRAFELFRQGKKVGVVTSKIPDSKNKDKEE